jgi:hypothetical protein
MPDKRRPNQSLQRNAGKRPFCGSALSSAWLILDVRQKMKIVSAFEFAAAIYFATSLFVPSIRPVVGRGMKNMRSAGPAFCVLSVIVMAAIGCATFLK